MLYLKRAYDPPTAEDGTRFLVERLWPRGVKKEDLRVDGWLKDAAPTDALHRWFGHDPKKWDEFRRRYFAELDRRPSGWEPIRKAAAHGNTTLIYSTHDTEHNNAVALRDYVLSKLGRKTRAGAVRRAA